MKDLEMEMKSGVKLNSMDENESCDDHDDPDQRRRQRKEGIKGMIILSNQAVVIIRSSTPSPILIIIIGIMASRMNRFRSRRSYPAELLHCYCIHERESERQRLNKRSKQGSK